MSWWGLLRSPFATVGFIADIAIQSAVVQRSSGAFSWPDALTEVEDESDALEPGELNHRFYCNRCGGGYYTGQHNCLRDSAERREALGPYTAGFSWPEKTTDVPGVPPAPGIDPAGVEQLPPVPPAGIDYDALYRGWK